MINKKALKCIIIVFTFLSLCHHRSYAIIRFLGLEKGAKKHLGIIGEIHHAYYQKSDPWAASEERDKKVILSLIDRLRHQGKQVHILIELSERNKDNATLLKGSCELGLLSTLGSLAAKHNNNYGPIQFKWIDNRGKVSQEIAESFYFFSNPFFAEVFVQNFFLLFSSDIMKEVENNHNTQLDIALRELPNGYTTNHFDRLLEACPSRMKEQFFAQNGIYDTILSRFKQNIKGFTVHDFFSAIDSSTQLLELTKKRYSENNQITSLFDKYLSKIEEARNKAQSFFATMANSIDSSKPKSCAEIIFYAAKQHSFAFVKDQMYEWFIPLTAAIVEASILSTVIDSLSECDTVIFVGGMNHAIELAEIAGSLGLKRDLAEGELEKDAPGKPVSTKSDFEDWRINNILQHMYEAFTEADPKKETHVQHRCANCGKTEGTLLRCSRCKEIHYCSKKCQVNDWQKHSRVCQKK